MVRDMRNTRPEKQSLTPMQKQAVLVCSVCALAAILTIAITMTLLKRGKTPAAPGEQPSSEVLVPGEEDISDHYQISETSAALLPETADAGESYQKETLFLGDSNTVRLYANGLISLQQFCAKEGIGTHAALNEGIVTFKKDSNTYTIAQAVAKMKPRRVVIMLGTNDTGMSGGRVHQELHRAGAGHSGKLPLHRHHREHGAAGACKPRKLPPHGPDQDRRLQHGPAVHV